jgi:hypothetical protein
LGAFGFKVPKSAKKSKIIFFPTKSVWAKKNAEFYVEFKSVEKFHKIFKPKS